MPEGTKQQCRILYVIGQLGPGGSERQLYYLLRRMDRETYLPAVAVWNFCDEGMYVAQIRGLGVPLYFFPKGFSRVAKLRAFRRLVRELRPEIVHSFSFYTNFAAWWSTVCMESISIGSIRQDFISERRTAGVILGRLSARFPARQVANSESAKHAAEMALWLFKPTHINVVRNPLDMDRFRFHPLAQNGTTVVAVGRLYPEKRWDRLLKTIAIVASRGLKFTVRLAGEGPLRGELESQARELGVQRFVQFLGLRHDIPDLLKDSTFLLHTADAEGCPNVVMEAMGCGRAVVATDAGDIPCLVEDGKTGFVVRRGDDTRLIEAMERLITDHELCRRMGESGRLKAEKEFLLEHFVTDMLTAYCVAGWKGA